ncbi:MAG: hypothetical protein QW568_03900 [Candidatus Anstonellaceae archaeon]
MAFDFLNRHGKLLAGITSLAGVVLAAVFCLKFQGLEITVKQGRSSLVWLIFSVSSAAYYWMRSGGKSAAGGHTNPLFKLALDFANVLPFIGLALSLLNYSAILESGIWKDAIAASSAFLDSIIVLFLAASLGAGIGSLKEYFSGKN